MLRSILFVASLLVGLATSYAQTTLPPNMYADSAYAPFYYGVASGTPTDTSIMLWTHVTPANVNDTVLVDWELATDTAFSSIVSSGTVTTNATVDHSVKTNVTGLSANTTYYYRFTANGITGRMGRTRTAPNGPMDEMKVAVLSCSSIFSGYFNAYARLAERDELNLVIHLGDYIYDFVDPDEEVRLPTPLLPNPGNLTEYRNQHKYHLLDPDLRAARQQHPWIVIWDNHDIEGNPGNNYNGSIQAFYEYVPILMVDSSKTDKIYNKYSFGDLLDVFMVDINLNRDQDTLPNGDNSAMGTTQRNWLFNELDNSTATWKILGNQKLFSNLYLGGASLPLSGWDAYEEERRIVLDHLGQSNIDNTIMISGDAHMAFMIDLTNDPRGLQGVYDTLNGDGAVGMEMLGGSISRGNLDEQLGAASPGIVGSVQNGALIANPNFRILNMVDHGYGLLTLRPDSVAGEFYLSEVLTQTNVETFGGGLIAYNGENHWRRTVYQRPLEVRENDTTTTIAEPVIPEDLPLMTIAPNPSNGQFKLLLDNLKGRTATIEVVDELGRHVLTRKIEISSTEQQYNLDLTNKASGIYVVRLINGGRTATSSLVISHDR